MDKPNRRRRWLRAAIILLVVGGVYLGYRAVRGDPNLRKVRALQKELFTADASKLVPEQRSDKFRQLREATEKLSPDQRKQLASEGQKRFEDELDRYRKMSPEEKRKYLDERIDRMERARQNAAQRAAAGAQGAGRGGPMAFGAGIGTAGGRQNVSAEERERRRKQRLDNTTPEFRAKMDQFMKDLQARRQQRGLPPGPGRRT
jgi:hypothetical protein